MITRENYEPFFVDYIEGNLPENMIDQFLDFLNQNPDLKDELHLFEEVNLPEEHIEFQEKEQLHKTTANETQRIENTLISYMEGDMDAEENEAFESYLAAHPELQKEYNHFLNTRLAPDMKIKFAQRRKLYRKPATLVVLNWVARAAAVLVLIWGINSVFQIQNTKEPGKRNPEVAGVSLKPESTVKKADSKKTGDKTAVPAKNKPEKAKNIPERTKGKPEATPPVAPTLADRDLIVLARITPIVPQLEQEPTEAQLAFAHPVDVLKTDETKKVMSVEEFLASRAKKVGKEGLFSAQRIARLGLNLASEISGERIGYKVKDGKIASVGFESKLMAFSIPLEKK